MGTRKSPKTQIIEAVLENVGGQGKAFLMTEVVAAAWAQLGYGGGTDGEQKDAWRGLSAAVKKVAKKDELVSIVDGLEVPTFAAIAKNGNIWTWKSMVAATEEEVRAAVNLLSWSIAKDRAKRKQLSLYADYLHSVKEER